MICSKKHSLLCKLLCTSAIFSNSLQFSFFCLLFLLGDKDGSKVTTVVATPGQGPDRPQEVSYTDTKVIGNGSFGVVYQAKLCDSGELVAIKKVLQDKRFKVRPLVFHAFCCCQLMWMSIFSNHFFLLQISFTVQIYCRHGIFSCVFCRDKSY